MKKTKFIALTIVLCFLLFQCEDSGFTENITFEKPYPGVRQDLSKILGTTFSLINEEDTAHFKMTYDPNQRWNYWISLPDQDTLFAGMVSRHKNLYFLNFKINDTTYQIQSLRIKDQYVQGVGSKWFQMTELYDRVASRAYQKLIKSFDSTSKDYHLYVRPKELQSFFESVLDSLPKVSLVTAKQLDKLQTESKDSSSKGFAVKLYPNPSTDFVQIEMSQEGNYLLELSDQQGKIMYQKKFSTAIFKLDLKGFRPGNYFLRFTDVPSRKIISKQLVIQNK